jgi:hypothetical protein
MRCQPCSPTPARAAALGLPAAPPALALCLCSVGLSAALRQQFAQPYRAACAWLPAGAGGPGRRHGTPARAAHELLILGGTRFLGRHLAEQALARGHQLTLLHRGQSGRACFPQAEHRMADRDGDLAALAR